MATKWKYEKRIVVGHDPITGKMIRVRVRGNTLAELKREILRAQARAYDKYAVDNITFGNFAKRWLTECKGMLSYNSQRTYQSDLNAFEDIFDVPIVKIRTSDLQKIFNENWNHARRCERMYLTVNQIFKYAYTEGILNENPCLRLTRPKRKKNEKRALTEEEVEAVKNASLAPLDRLFLDIEYYFGLRPEECRALKGADFDLDKSHLQINKAATFVHHNGVIKETKNQQIRAIPIPADFSSKHRKEIEKCPSYLFARNKKELFNETDYKRMYRRIFSAINKELGGNDEIDRLNKMTMYTLRHHFCTQLYYGINENKITTKMAAYLAGNSVHVFLSSYAHLDRDRETESAINILNNL